VLLQTAQQPSILGLAVPFLIVFGIYYAIVILPTRRTQKKTQEMIDNLKVGDKVITTGGIYGTVAGLRDDRIQIKVAESVKLEVAKTAITALQNSGDSSGKSS